MAREAPRRAPGGARSLIKRCHSAAVCEFTKKLRNRRRASPDFLAPVNRAATPQRFKSYFLKHINGRSVSATLKGGGKIGVIPRRGTTSEENHVNGARGAQVLGCNTHGRPRGDPGGTK